MESEGTPTAGVTYHNSSSFVEQNKRPVMSKRRKAEEEEMVAIKKVCERARQILEEQPCAIDRGLRLADIPSNSVIEVFEMVPVTTVHGAAGIMRCVIEESNGARTVTKVCVPERYAIQSVPVSRCTKEPGGLRKKVPSTQPAPTTFSHWDPWKRTGQSLGLRHATIAPDPHRSWPTFMKCKR